MEVKCKVYLSYNFLEKLEWRLKEKFINFRDMIKKMINLWFY